MYAPLYDIIQRREAEVVTSEIVSCVHVGPSVET
jgi:hypothetical protein